jgi:hypothetical protein
MVVGAAVDVVAEVVATVGNDGLEVGDAVDRLAVLVAPSSSLKATIPSRISAAARTTYQRRHHGPPLARRRGGGDPQPDGDGGGGPQP